MKELEKIERMLRRGEMPRTDFIRFRAVLMAAFFALIMVGCGEDEPNTPPEPDHIVVKAPADQIMPLELIFKAEIDVSKIEEGDISVKDSEGNQVAIIYSFGDDLRTLTIITENTDGWKTGSNNQYHYYVSLVDVNGNRVVSDNTFAVYGPIRPVRSVYADEFTCMLRWETLENVDGYDLYVEQRDSDKYELLASVGNRHEIDIYELLQSKNKPFADYYIKVVGRNPDGVGKLSDAPVAYFTYALIAPPVKVLSFDAETETITWEKLKLNQTYVQNYHFYVEGVGEYPFPCRYVGKYTSTDNRPEISINVIDEKFCSYSNEEYIIRIAGATAAPSIRAVKDAIVTKYVCVVKVPPPVKDLAYDADTRKVSWKKPLPEKKMSSYYHMNVRTVNGEYSQSFWVNKDLINYQGDRVVFDAEGNINSLAWDGLAQEEVFEFDKYYVKIIPISDRNIDGDFDKAEEVLIDFTFIPPYWWDYHDRYDY